MGRMGILLLGFSAAVWAGFAFQCAFPGRNSWWTTLCVGGGYIAMSILLFFECKCGKSKPTDSDSAHH